MLNKDRALIQMDELKSVVPLAESCTLLLCPISVVRYDYGYRGFEILCFLDLLLFTGAWAFVVAY